MGPWELHLRDLVEKFLFFSSSVCSHPIRKRMLHVHFENMVFMLLLLFHFDDDARAVETERNFWRYFCKHLRKDSTWKLLSMAKMLQELCSISLPIDLTWTTDEIIFNYPSTLLKSFCGSYAILRRRTIQLILLMRCQHMKNICMEGDEKRGLNWWCQICHDLTTINFMRCSKFKQSRLFHFTDGAASKHW